MTLADVAQRNRARKKRVWERCPTCDQRLEIPRGAMITVEVLIAAAEHVQTQRHQDAMAVIRVLEQGLKALPPVDETAEVSEPEPTVDE